MHGTVSSGYAPCVVGHEGAGVVERVGEDVTLVAAGDRVVTLFSPQCGSCVHCRSGRTNLCLAIRAQQNAGYLTGGFGADYTFEATGLVRVMRQAVEAARMGWGLATICGVAGKGETLDVIPRWLIQGRRPRTASAA